MLGPNEKLSTMQTPNGMLSSGDTIVGENQDQRPEKREHCCTHNAFVGDTQFQLSEETQQLRRNLVMKSENFTREKICIWKSRK